ncbi:MAG: hypothetical protein GF408_04520 [Candidatus Omnitrophica bacterium]|nr:hypothetical protein [Candidatus Omnitrophota bacterium]
MVLIHDKRIPGKYILRLKERLPEAEFVPFGGMNGPEAVYGSILCHPDIYFFRSGPCSVVHSPGLPPEVLDVISHNGIELVEGREPPRGKYPGTTRYNAARVGRWVFLNTRFADPAVLEEINERGLSAVHVEQGYSRCSVFPVDEGSFITNDDVIAREGMERGLDVLSISPSGIELPGERHGFIGGTGEVSDRALIFAGDPAEHAEGEKILSFISKSGKEHVFVPEEPLYDCGTMMLFGDPGRY